MKRDNEKGVALIAAVMVVAILAGIGVSFSFNMRLEERAAANHLWMIQADAIARGGIERAIRELIDPARRDEQYTFIPRYEIHDDPTLQGDLNTDIPVYDPRYQEAFTITFPQIDIGDGLTLRGGVVLRDEAGKVNLNVSGHGIDTIEFTGAGIDRGWTTAEIGLPSDGESLLRWSAAWNTKFGDDGQPGAAGVDDNFNNAILGFDGIDNDGDGEVDEWREGFDEPSEFVFLEGGRTTLDFTHDDRPFITIGETIAEGMDLSLYTTLFSRDRCINSDVWWNADDEEWEDKININTATWRQLADLPGISTQVALNIVDFRDADNVPTDIGGGRRGIERTLFINEVWSDEYRHWWGWPPGREFNKVEAVELINPWTERVRGSYRIIWRHWEAVQTFDSRWHNVPAGGIWSRYDDHLRDRAVRTPGGTIELWGHLGGGWRLIESVQLATTGRRVDAKNDPRVPHFPFSGPYASHSRGRVNAADQGFNPRIRGEVAVSPHWQGHGNHFNRNFHNIGELGLIRTGGQWETLAMRDIVITDNGTVILHRPHQGAILNRVTIGHPFNRMGRININTASFDILISLPQMFQGRQAQAIYDRVRGYYDAAGDWIYPNPFNTIGEVVPYLFTVVSAEAEITVTITRLMRSVVNFVNKAIHWPSTWGWPFRSIGDRISAHFVRMLEEFLPPGIPFHNPPIGGNPPQWITLEDRPTIAFVRGVSEVVVQTTNRIIVWVRRTIPDWFGWREKLIARHLIPIVRGASTAYEYTLAGDDLDGDGFFAEDDERETIVRSISNLITTRSDRFEIVSTGSVWRGGEELVKSRMRAIVCRIARCPDDYPLVTILHFERR